MADTQNNSRALKAKEKAGWSRQRLAILVKPVCRLWKWLDNHLDRWLAFTAIILAVIFFAVIFSDQALAFMRHLLGTDSKRETLTFIMFGIGGLALLHWAVSAEKQTKAMNDMIRNQVKKSGLTGAGRTQERLTQEHLKASIEHLGSPKESVRIGAAYELYHLAKNRECREIACDILCGYIKQKTREENYRKQQKNKPSGEIKIFLNLLCGEGESPFRKCRKCQTDLSSSFLRGADLSGAYLQGADLSGAYLQGANLSEAQLQGADLSEAQLQGANLSEAQRQGANLSEAQLQGANLQWAEMQGANLQWAEMQGTGLWKSHLQGVSSSGELSKMSFQDRIRARTGEEGDFTNAVFSGGLDADQVKEIIASMPGAMDDKRKEEMKNRLNEHVDKEAGRKLPDNSGAITGAYNKDEAEKWITDYEKSTNRQSAADKTATRGL